jgi:hypothetical protein
MTKFTMKDSGVSDLSGLYLLRFLLALSILIVHFPHFFFPYAGAQLDRSVMPFQPYLDPIYAYGGFPGDILDDFGGDILRFLYA